VLDGGLVVFGRYEDCSRILRDPRASSERERSRLVPPELRERERTKSFLSLDPPDHTRLRSLVARAFTPRVVATLAPRISQVTDELLSAAAGGGEIELVARLAYPLPVRIISSCSGCPPRTTQVRLVGEAGAFGATFGAACGPSGAVSITPGSSSASTSPS
jgi:cytochrome P450